MTGTKLKALRTYLGLSQRQFSESIGTGHDVICRWEAGKHKISLAYQKVIEAKYRKELKRIS
jgi:DNA-binding transcriptional regulator YiaG